MIPVYLLMLAGLLLLFFSGKYLVESSVAIARRLRIPAMVIGLTVVALGTSAPELLVSIQAASKGFPEIAIGNIVGSNISNILLVLAITAVIFPISVPPSSVRKDWPIMMFVALLLFVFTLNGNLGRAEGILLLLFLAGYIIMTVIQSRKPGPVYRDDETGRGPKWWTAGVIFAASCAGLAFGADLLVNNAAIIAENLGLSQRVISVTMVAVGTSLPELVTCVIAALKKETDIAIGNIIGSNTMNIIAVLGMTSVIKPIGVERAIATFDIPWMIGTSLLLFLIMLPAVRSRINRWEGALMILIYLLYIYLLF
ncbi:MAG: calcium/sodium antiporter [Bacteroidetes bacterium]|nr:MAG: calcium/sodium antiporter [Bacteroidota bacterium]